MTLPDIPKIEIGFFLYFSVYVCLCVHACVHGCVCMHVCMGVCVWYKMGDFSVLYGCAILSGAVYFPVPYLP